MATIKALSFGDAGADTGQLDIMRLGLYKFTETSRTSARFYDDGKNYALFTGSNLKFIKSGQEIEDITGGVVTGLELSTGGVKLFTVTGLKLLASKLFDYYVAGKADAAWNYFFSGDDRITGTGHHDTLAGGAGVDTISGGRGDDFLNGMSGKDRLIGGDGDDILHGGADADRLEGGSGRDMASYFYATKGVVANLAKASSNTNDAKGDIYSSVEDIAGSRFNDTLKGNERSNFIGGNAGADKLTGGAGADTFVFVATSDSTRSAKGRDIITDFKQSEKDQIDLHAIDANSKLSRDQAFTFIAGEDFHRKAGELRYERTGGDTLIQGDVNGDGKADFAILIDASVKLGVGDFIL